jgi:hypothetical protein
MLPMTHAMVGTTLLIDHVTDYRDDTTTDTNNVPTCHHCGIGSTKWS